MGKKNKKNRSNGNNNQPNGDNTNQEQKPVETNESVATGTPEPKTEGNPSAHSEQTTETVIIDDTSTDGDMMSESGEEKKSTWQIVIAIIVIIVLILIFALPGDGEEGDKKDKKSRDDNMEQVDDVDGDHMEDDDHNNDDDDNDSTSSNLGTQAMEPIQDGEFTYQFEGITWEFSPVGNNTSVAFRLDKFSRREGSLITLRRPFVLGTYPGTCDNVTTIRGTSSLGKPLSFARCDSEGEEERTTEIVIAQDGENVRAYHRGYEPGESKGSFEEFFTRDITAIIK